MDGMKITVGDVTATIYQRQVTHRASIGMVVPVKFQGANHPILLVTAATDVHNRESFIGGYEHIGIWGYRRRSSPSCKSIRTPT